MRDSSRQGVWRRALRNADFRHLLGALSVSQTGDWLYSVALVVFIFEATHSVGWVAASVVAKEIAYISFSAVGGALADRFDRRRWMIGVNLGEALILAAMAAVAAGGGPTAVMIGLAFCVSVLAACYHPAAFAMIPAVVAEDDLAASNAVVSTVEQVAYAVGPALGALVVALSSTAPAFAIDAATFLVAAWLISGLQGTDRGESDEAPASMREQLVEGVRAVAKSPSAAVVLAMITGALAAYGFEQVLYVAVSANRLGTGSSGVGVMSAAYGAGSITASLVVGRIAGRSRPVPVLAATVFLLGLSLMSLAAITLPAFAYMALFVSGASFLTFEVVSLTVLQRTVDPKLMGRVYGILMTLGSIATLSGSLVAPALAEGIDLRIALVAGGSIPLAVLVVVGGRLVRLDRAATERGKELELRIAALTPLAIFEGASIPAIERLAEVLTEEEVTAGTLVVREGDIADAFFIAREGKFDETALRDARTVQLDELQTGDWFGEIGLADGLVRPTTVTALTDGIVWRIDREDFLSALEQTSDLTAPVEER